MSRAWLLSVFVLPLLFAALPLASIAFNGGGQGPTRAVVVTTVGQDLPAVPVRPAGSVSLSAAVDPFQDCLHASSGAIEG
ncbi:MAG: hypothetical protein IT304_10600 [Dehalococcoidia bacterium]|nr:hypothetical protein [Dehalococcoidia bacterium]